jgi:hypothetical protein
MATMGTLERCKDMIYRRWAHAMVSVFDSVFALGGYTHPNKPGAVPVTLRTVEKFNIENQEWQEVAPMHSARAFFGAVTIIDQFIYAFGGFNGWEMLTSFEKYDDLLNNWTVIKLDFPTARAKFGCVSLAAAKGCSKTDIMILGGIGPDFIRKNDAWIVNLEFYTFK